MGRWCREYYKAGRRYQIKKPKKRHSKNSTKEKKAKNGTKDHQKQTRKAHTVRKTGDPETVHYRQTKKGQSNKNLKGCRINKE